MIFRAPLIRKILAGAKTQTRRPVRAGETDCRYQVGHSYAVQPGRGQAAVARILILAVRQERLGEIGARAAQREGFKRVDQFFDYWRSLYGKVDYDQVVWVIQFSLVNDQPVRLLHRDSSHGYTDKPALAMEGEPEAVPAGWKDPGMLAARARHEEARRDDTRRWNALSVGARVREAALSAERAGVDITPELAAIARQVEAIENKQRAA